MTDELIIWGGLGNLRSLQLEPKKLWILKIVGLFFWDRTIPATKKNTTPEDHQKWPNHYRTASSPMAFIGHYLAKNHPTKNPIKQKYSPRPRAPSWRAPWRCTMVWSFPGFPTWPTMFSATKSSSAWNLWWFEGYNTQQLTTLCLPVKRKG